MVPKTLSIVLVLFSSGAKVLIKCQYSVANAFYVEVGRELWAPTLVLIKRFWEMFQVVRNIMVSNIMNGNIV